MTYYLWLLEQALSGVLYFWPISIILLVALISLLVGHWNTLGTACASARLWLLGPFLVPFAVLLLGTVLRAPGTEMQTQDRSLHGLYALLFAAAVYSVVVVVRARGLRWLAVGVVLFAGWLSLLAALVAASSMIGDWL